MEKGTRYTVRTRYGWFSLDEGSYRDYLEGKLLWIDWPPLGNKKKPERSEPLPQNVSQEALGLRDRAEKEGVLEILQEFGSQPTPPCKARLESRDIYELNLSVRSSNGLMRAGVRTFGALNRLIRSEGGVASVRNLGAKSEKEILTTFMEACYTLLQPYEKAEFWQEVLDQNEGSAP